MRTTSFKTVKPGVQRGDDDDLGDPRFTQITQEGDANLKGRTSYNTLLQRIERSIQEDLRDFSNSPPSKNDISQGEIMNAFRKSDEASIFEKSGKKQMYIDISSQSLLHPIKLTTINEVFDILGLQLVNNQFIFKNRLYQIALGLTQGPSKFKQSKQLSDSINDYMRLKAQSLNTFDFQVSDQSCEELVFKVKSEIGVDESKELNTVMLSESSTNNRVSKMAEHLHTKQYSIKLAKDTFYKNGSSKSSLLDNDKELNAPLISPKSQNVMSIKLKNGKHETSVMDQMISEYSKDEFSPQQHSQTLEQQLSYLQQENQLLMEQLQDSKKQLDTLNLKVLGQQFRQSNIHLAFMFCQPIVSFENSSYIQLPQDLSLNPLHEFEDIKQSIGKTNREVRIMNQHCNVQNFSQLFIQKPQALHLTGQCGLPIQSLLRKDFGSYLMLETEDGQAEFVHEKIIQGFIQTSGTVLEFVFLASFQSDNAAQIFINSGAKHVICIKQGEKVSQEAIKAFSRLFYNSVYNQSMSICESFKIAQKKVEVIYGAIESLKFQILVKNEDNPFKDTLQINDILNTQSFKHVCNMMGPIRKGQLICQDHPVCFKSIPQRSEEFVGRGKDIHEIVQNLKQNKVVTIIGLPGIGKSQLAIETSHFLLKRQIFSLGVVYMDLRGIQNTGLFIRKLNCILSKISKNDNQDCFKYLYKLSSDMQFIQIQENLRKTERSLLLCFDNGEDLLHHDKSNLRCIINELLVNCPKVRVLITSRTVIGDLRDQNEKVYVLQGLQNKEVTELYTKLSKKLQIQNISEVQSSKSDQKSQKSGSKSNDSASSKKIISNIDAIFMMTGNPQAIVFCAQLMKFLKPGQIYRQLRSESYQKLLKEEQIKNPLVASLRLITDLLMKQIDKFDPQLCKTLNILSMMQGGITMKHYKKVFNALHGEQIIQDLIEYNLVYYLTIDNKSSTKAYYVYPYVAQFCQARINQEEKVHVQRQMGQFYALILDKIFRLNNKTRKDAAKRYERDQILNDKLLKHETNIIQCIYRMIEVPLINYRKINSDKINNENYKSLSESSSQIFKLDDEISIQVFDANKNEIDEQSFIDQVIKDSFVQFSKLQPSASQSLISQFKEPVISTDSISSSRNPRLSTSKDKYLDSNFEDQDSTSLSEIKLFNVEKLIILYISNLILFGESNLALNIIENQGVKVKGNQLYMANLFRLQGLIYFGQREVKKAIQVFRKSKNLFLNMNSNHGVAITRYALACLKWQQIDPKQPIDGYQYNQISNTRHKFSKILFLNFKPSNHLIGQAFCHHQITQLLKIQFSYFDQNVDQELLRYEFLENQELYLQYLKEFSDYKQKKKCPHVRRQQGPDISLMIELVTTANNQNLFPSKRRANSMPDHRDKMIEQDDSLLIGLDSLDDDKSAYTYFEVSPLRSSHQLRNSKVSNESMKDDKIMSGQENLIGEISIDQHASEYYFEKDNKQYCHSEVLYRKSKSNVVDESVIFSIDLLELEEEDQKKGHHITEKINPEMNQESFSNAIQVYGSESQNYQDQSQQQNNSNPGFYSNTTRRSMQLQPLEVVIEETEPSLLEINELDNKQKSKLFISKIPMTNRHRRVSVDAAFSQTLQVKKPITNSTTSIQKQALNTVIVNSGIKKPSGSLSNRNNTSTIKKSRTQSKSFNK